MTCEKHRLMRERAIQLRLDGLSKGQIADVLQMSARSKRLAAWLRGTPPPAWTLRPRAKDDLRERAIEMRREGHSYREIRRVLEVSMSSLSLWLRDVPLSAEHAEELYRRRVENGVRLGSANRARRLSRERKEREAGRTEIGPVSDRELFVAGVLLYWAEGAKPKPWRPAERVMFANSDEGLVRLFLRWLDVLGIGRDRLRVRLHIHESANVTEALGYWSRVTNVPVEQFGKTTLKRHNPKPGRRNLGDAYVGCLKISVLGSTDLNRRLVGWYEGIVMGADPVARSVTAARRLLVPSGGGSNPPGPAGRGSCVFESSVSYRWPDVG